MSADTSRVLPSIDPGVGIARESELSLAQEQIWVFEQFTPGTAVYNEPFALHFNGYLGVDVLESSLMEIVRRHEVLRASFREVDGHPVQVVESASTVMVVRCDVPRAGGADGLERVKRACEAECRRPFDLVHGPPIRFTLFRLSSTEHVLLIVCAPSRLRRVVERHPPAGAGRALRRLLERAARSRPATVDPVFRFR